MTQASSQSGSPRALGGLAAVFRWAEMVFFFFVLPGVAALAVDPRRRGEGVLRGVGLGFLYELPLPGARLLLPMLVLFTLAVVVWLLLDPTFDRRRLWNAAGVRGEWKRMAVLFAVGAGVMLAAAWGLDRFGGGGGEDGYAFLGLARRSPRLLVVIAVLYPWLSAYPQEISHRAFFFHRYGPILRSTPVLIAVNALAFMWLHAPFWNPWAFALTLPGGVLFAWTYARSGSVLAATLEHAAYGWWAFFVGLGWFVYAGSIGQG